MQSLNLSLMQNDLPLPKWTLSTHPLAPSLKKGGGMSPLLPSEQSPSLFQGGVGVGTSPDRQLITDNR